MKRIIVNSLFLLATVVILLLLAEGVTRLVMPDIVRLRLLHIPDQKLGYRLRPNYDITYNTAEFSTVIKINSEGLRDHEYPKEKSPNVFRILIVGDSFTFGRGVNVEESYPKVLESLLNQHLRGDNSKRYEVLNAAVDGYGTEQEYFYIKELLPRYRPDLVIVGLYYNDVDDVMKGIPASLYKSNLKNRFYFLSYLYNLRFLALRILKNKNNIAEDLLGIYQDHYSPQFQKALDMTKEYLAGIRDLSLSVHAKTCIVIIPSCFEIDKSEWVARKLERFYSDDFFKKNMAKFSEIFTEFGKTNKIPTLPLLPVFRNSTLRPLYFTRDAHWTKEGHKLAAEALYDYLTKERFFIR